MATKHSAGKVSGKSNTGKRFQQDRGKITTFNSSDSARNTGVVGHAGSVPNTISSSDGASVSQVRKLKKAPSGR